ncbi:uncharacterized protein [Procambarus clarkii]|uniref:uncharacterized protein isoform X2 n=1 Tax=Procambarus clarkii TaxID=6728 RepID=UPI0037444DCA
MLLEMFPSFLPDFRSAVSDKSEATVMMENWDGCCCCMCDVTCAASVCDVTCAASVCDVTCAASVCDVTCAASVCDVTCAASVCDVTCAARSGMADVTSRTTGRTKRAVTCEMPGISCSARGHSGGTGVTSSTRGHSLTWPWALVAVLAWAATTTLAHPPPQQIPTIWEHFFVDGCNNTSDRNLTKELDLRSLLDGFYLELDIYGHNSPRLVAKSYEHCRLPSGALYRALLSGTHKKNVVVAFSEVPDDLVGEEDAGEGGGGAEGDTGGATGGTKNIHKCKLPLNKPITLLSGYGFLSCSEAGQQRASSLQAWREDVQAAEDEIISTRTKIMGGVGGGMALLLLGCAVCVVMRVRRSPREDYASRGRRPSQQSIKTRTTGEFPSSTTRSLQRVNQSSAHQKVLASASAGLTGSKRLRQMCLVRHVL